MLKVLMSIVRMSTQMSHGPCPTTFYGNSKWSDWRRAARRHRDRWTTGLVGATADASGHRARYPASRVRTCSSGAVQTAGGMMLKVLVSIVRMSVISAPRPCPTTFYGNDR